LQQGPFSLLTHGIQSTRFRELAQERCVTADDRCVELMLSSIELQLQKEMK
jgi:hypothetical protein